MSVNVSEFQTRLKKQGLRLCFPVGKSLNAALRHFGFEANQEVVLRFRHRRLEILPRTSAEVARDEMLSAAGEIRSVRERMQVIADAFSDVTDDELEKEETPEAELLGLLECLLSDDLDPAIEKLESVASLKLPVPVQEPAPADLQQAPTPEPEKRTPSKRSRGRDGASPAGSR